MMKNVIKSILEQYGENQIDGVLVNEIQQEHHHGIQKQEAVKAISLIQLVLLLENENDDS